MGIPTSSEQIDRHHITMWLRVALLVCTCSLLAAAGVLIRKEMMGSAGAMQFTPLEDCVTGKPASRWFGAPVSVWTVGTNWYAISLYRVPGDQILCQRFELAESGDMLLELRNGNMMADLSVSVKVISGHETAGVSDIRLVRQSEIRILSRQKVSIVEIQVRLAAQGQDWPEFMTPLLVRVIPCPPKVAKALPLSSDTARVSVADATDAVHGLNQPPPSRLLTPSDGATNLASDLNFSWTNVAGAQAYYLYVERKLGAKDLVDTGEILGTSLVAKSLPSETTLYATIWTKLRGEWHPSKSISFTTAPTSFHPLTQKMRGWFGIAGEQGQFVGLIAAHLLLLGVVLLAIVLVKRKNCPASHYVIGAAFAAFMMANTAVSLKNYRMVRDMELPAFIAKEGAPGGNNLSYTVDTVHRVVSGTGLGALYNPQRTPGSLIFAVIASIVGRADTGNFASIYYTVVVAYLVLVALGLAVLVAAMLRALPAVSAIVTAAVLATKTPDFFFVQADTIILPLWLFVCSAIFYLIAELKNESSIGLLRVLFLHIAFGCLAFCRGEFVLLWLAATIIIPLHRRLGIACLISGLVFLTVSQGILGILAGKGFHPRLGTLTTGHVAFVGLWQNAFHPFVWQPSDESYDQWIKSHGLVYNSEPANKFATEEILRFYATFPIYTTFQAINKFHGYWAYNNGGGYLQSYSLWPERINWFRGFGGLAILTIALFSLLWCENARLRLLVALPLLISLPLFCLIQYDGARFTTYVDESLIILGVPALLNAALWRKVWTRKIFCVTLVLAMMVAFAAYPSLKGWMLKNRELLLWSPILPKEDSTLYQLKRP